MLVPGVVVGRLGPPVSRPTVRFASVNFHFTGPSTCLIDSGAQHSCIGQKTFVSLGGNLESLSKSTYSYVFGDGKPSPSIGRTKIEFLVHEFNIDVVSQDVPRFIGMDILESKDQDRSIFHLDIYIEKRNIEVSKSFNFGNLKS